MRINRTFLAACRTIHIYLTMAALIVLLGFAFTGMTLNHKSWFGADAPRVSKSTGRISPELAAGGDSLHVVEQIRQQFHISAGMTAFDESADVYSINFRSPDEQYLVEVDKSSGGVKVRDEAYNMMAIVNNLHRAHYTGKVWSWMIDVSAVLLMLACATGFVLWLALPKRRKLGVAGMFLGTVAVVGIIMKYVPGSNDDGQAISMLAAAGVAKHGKTSDGK